MNLAVNARDAMPGGGKLLLETSAAECGSAGTPPVEESGAAGSKDFRPAFRQGPGPCCGCTMTGWECRRKPGLTCSSRSSRRRPRERVRASGFLRSTGSSHSPGAGSPWTAPRAGEACSRWHFRACSLPVRSRPRTRSRCTCSRAAEPSSWWKMSRTFASWPRRVLERGGYRVVSVASAREALLVAEGSTQLDLVVTDVVMPGGMSGVEMGERLSRTRPKLPGPVRVRLHRPRQVPFSVRTPAACPCSASPSSPTICSPA